MDNDTIREIAITTGKIVDLLTPYIDGPASQIAGIAEEYLKYIRRKQLINLFDKTNKLLIKKGYQSKKIPLNIAFPLIQAGSLEEDDWMQDQWANLLANAVDASSSIEMRRAFISILEDLSPLDAQIIKKIYSFSLKYDTTNGVWTKHLPEHLYREKPDTEDLIPSTNVLTSLGNLSRLGLISSAVMYSGKHELDCIFPTQLGYNFARAVDRE
ncbi:MAG: DUF4393 domain-containing protein [Chlorobiaceae bacterium]|nr:DUF4393 domain-containing protein [Chlorobiaceae bacterium]